MNASGTDSNEAVGIEPFANYTSEMPVLDFPNLDTLRLVLASGTLPTEVTDTPAWVAQEERGRVRLEPSAFPSREMLTGLNRLGVRLVAEMAPHVISVGCWAELLALRPASPQTMLASGPVLFVLPTSELARFTVRLRRFGAPTQALRFPLPETAWIIQDGAPPSMLEQTLDRDSPIEPFTEHAPGIWIRHAWDHPVPARLVAPTTGTLLLRPDRASERVAVRVPVPVADEFLLHRQPASRGVNSPLKRIAILMRLTREPQRERERLWLCADDDIVEFRRFCLNADQRLIRRFEIATQRSGTGIRFVLRSVPGEHMPPLLPASLRGFAPHPRAAGLFLPANRCLKPELRSAELSDLFGLGPDRLTWVEAGTDGRIITQAILLEAFRPLESVLFHVVPTQARFAANNFAEDRFPLPRFVLRDEHAVEPFTDRSESLPTREQTEEIPTENSKSWVTHALERFALRLRRPRREPMPKDRPGSEPGTAPLPYPVISEPETPSNSVDALLHGRDRAARRHALEAALLADFAGLEPSQRAERWAELAAVYGATRNAADAAVCWINAIWEADPVPMTWLEQWLLAECRATKLTEPSISLDRILGEPGRFGMGRTLAAFITQAAAELTLPHDLKASLARILSYLDQHFEDLSARAAWLVRLALTRFVAGDALGLAQWHDRILARLRQRGPALDLDEPSFLRFHGSTTSEQFQTARDWLTKSRGCILGWVAKLGSSGRLQWAGLDPETDCTAAYSQLMLAWGLGHLGERTRSRDWAARARKVLSLATGPGVDPAVHALLADAYAIRTREAQEGSASKPGFPSELSARYDSLPAFSRYAVDKLRRFSRILEPAGHVRDYRGQEFREFWGHDRLGERLSVFADHLHADSVVEEAQQLLVECSTSPNSATVPRIVFTLLDAASHLDASTVSQLLEHVPPALEWMETWLQSGRWTDAERMELLPRYQARMLEAALTIAAQREQFEASQGLVDHLLNRIPSDSMLRAALAQAAPTAFRCFRKRGSRSEAESLLRSLDPGCGAWPAESHFSPVRLGLAIGWFAVGDEESGNRILNDARDRLFLAAPGDDRNHTELAIAYAGALGSAPPRIALGRLEEIFQRLDRITLTGSTNRYYSLKMLELIDAVVRAVVTEDFTLSPAVRGWMDDDEFLIRRRLHRDMTQVLHGDNLR